MSPRVMWKNRSTSSTSALLVYSGLRRLSHWPQILCGSLSAQQKGQKCPVYSPLCWSSAALFKNAKEYYGRRGADEEAEGKNQAGNGQDPASHHTAEARAAAEQLFGSTNQGQFVSFDNMPSAHSLDTKLPSLNQLRNELPSAAELEQATRDGTLDKFAVKASNDDDPQ